MSQRNSKGSYEVKPNEALVWNGVDSHNGEAIIVQTKYKEIHSRPSQPSIHEDVVDGDEGDDEVVDLSCGLGRLRTNIFGSWYANLYVFAVITGLASMFSLMARRIVSVQLTSLEKQFKIDNTYAGLFETTSKIGLLSTILFSGHFTRKAHLPMVIALSGIVQGLCMMAPAFLQLADPYTLPVLSYQNETNSSRASDKYMCAAYLVNSTDSDMPHITNTTEDPNRLALIVLLVSQTMKGVAESFHTSYLPTVYMDNNMLDKTKMSLFLGIRLFIDGFSGPIGTEINGILTEIPIDLKKTDMNPKDSRFVAAWWLAFLVFGAGMALTSLPLLFFPKNLISEKQRLRAQKISKVTYSGGEVEDENSNKKNTHLKSDMPKIVIESEDQIASQLPDPTVHQTDTTDGQLGHINERRGSSVSVPMGRKLSLFPPLEGPTERKVSLTGDIVFDQPAKRKQEGTGDPEPSTLKELIKDLPKSFLRLAKNPIFVLGIIDIGIVSIPLSGMYMFRNVYMTMEFNVPMSEVTLASSLTSAVGTLSGTVLSSWLTTKARSKVSLQGIVMSVYLIQVFFNPLFLVFGCDNKPVYGFTGEMGLPINLTEGCDCSYAKQLLSCGDDGNNYFSPCHAGCKSVNGRMFTDCQGLVNSSFGTSVSPGVCSTQCHDNFLLYAILHGVQYMVESAIMIPRWVLVLRVVEPQDRGFATSFFIFFYNIMSIPSPNVFGKLIDNACFIWDGHLCNLYDRDTIRYLMSGLDVGVNVLSVLANLPMLIILWLEHRRMKREKKLRRQKEKEQNMELEEKEQKLTEVYKF